MRPEQPIQTLVVVELGAEWPDWLNEQLGQGSRRVVAERDADQPGVLATRVADLIDSERIFPRSAVLLCNERADAAQRAVRLDVGRAVLRALSQGKGAELLFAAPTRSSERSREALRSLLGELNAQRSGAVRARVRFDADRSAIQSRAIARVA